MPGIARNGDTCGGTIEATATKMTVNGRAVALGPGVVNGVPGSGDSVTDHGDNAHNSATLVAGSAKITCEGRPVVLVGHAASCGHAVSSGSGNATASG